MGAVSISALTKPRELLASTFRLLKIPEVASDISRNDTMHQILRLLYADQLSPIENPFRFERFDQPALRDAIGRLLCGADDSTIYDNEIRVRSLSREYDTVSAELICVIFERPIASRTDSKANITKMGCHSSGVIQCRNLGLKTLDEPCRVRDREHQCITILARGYNVCLQTLNVGMDLFLRF